MKKPTWVAVYTSGETLPQFNEDGTENQYKDIDRENLEFFELYRRDELIFRLHFDKNKRLIYRRRILITTGGGRETITLIGFQETARNKNFQAICLIFPDGHLEMLPKWKEGIYGKPVFKEFE